MFHKTFKALKRQMSVNVPVSLSSHGLVESLPLLGGRVKTKWDVVCEAVIHLAGFFGSRRTLQQME